MESSAVDAGYLGQPPRRRWVVDWRLIGIVILIDVVAAFLAYMVVYVPLVGPMLTREESLQHWPAALIGALVVAAGVLLVIRETRRARRASASSPAVDAADAPPEQAERPRIPRALGLEHVPKPAAAAAAAISVATVPASLLLGASFPLAWLAFIAPWIPVVVIEARWKHTRDALFTGFALVVILQLLHMVEHSVQVGQLLASGGALAQSHGIFGQLDFELVHFVTDTVLWITLGVLVITFRARNLWLCVAFAAASLHQVEHFYLFWLYHADNNLYLAGGFAGIMGKDGLIGSPLDRPYLHYTYNMIVLVPMLIAVWDDARRVDRRFARSAGSAPGRSATAPAA